MLLRKKIFSQVVMTGVLLLLVGCSNKEGNTSNNKEDVEVSQDNVNEIENKYINEAVQDNQNPTEDVSVSDEDVVEPEEISLSVDVNSINPEEAYEGLYRCEYPTITVTNDEYAELNNGLELVNESIKDKAEMYVDDFEKTISRYSDLTVLPEDPYSYEMSVDITRSDSVIISIDCLTHVEMYEYHPIYETDTYNINPSDGSILEIEDILDLNDDFYAVICNAIEAQYSDAEFYDYVDLTTDIKNFFENEDEYEKKYNYKKLSFYISYEDIWFEFGGMEITDYYAGDTVVTIPINDVRDYLKIQL